MNSDTEDKLVGINAWFMIEILSFYGYIFSAVIYIMITSIRGSCGHFKKEPYCDTYKDRYKHDFIAYHRKDLDWAAFVQILFNVNVVIMCIDKFIIFKDDTKEMDEKNHPLRSITY